MGVEVCSGRKGRGRKCQDDVTGTAISASSFSFGGMDGNFVQSRVLKFGGFEWEDETLLRWQFYSEPSTKSKPV